MERRHLQNVDVSWGHEPALSSSADWQSAVSQIGNLRPLDLTGALPTASRRNSRLPTRATSQLMGSLHRRGVFIRPYFQLSNRFANKLAGWKIVGFRQPGHATP